MSGNDHIDRELESFLKDDESRIAALYRKLPRPEPDAKLDAAVLAMARAAVATKRVRPRWMPALGAAAAVLFAAGVAYRVGPQVWNDRGDGAENSATRNALEKQAAPAESAPVAPPPAVSPAPSMQRDAEAFPADSAVKTSKPKMTAELPPPAALARQKSAAAKAAPQLVAAPATIGEVRADKISGGATQMQVSPPTPPAQAAPLQSLDANTSPGDEAQKRKAEERAAPKNQNTESRSEPALKTMSDAAPAAAAPPAARTMNAPAPPPAAAPDPNLNLYPESWVANIQKMLRENRRDDALRSLAEFRKKYPAYHLPDDLRDLK